MVKRIRLVSLGIVAVLKHRWATGVGIAVVIVLAVVSRVLGPEFEGYLLAWGVFVSGVVYLAR